MNDAQFEKLRDEVLKAERAERSYKEFIGPFIEEKKKQLFESFEAISSSDVDGLKDLKLMSLALTALDSDIQSIINTGKLASETLSKNEEVH